jgi:hypothetical protein
LQGFQERKPRRPTKKIPAWVTDPKLLEAVVNFHSEAAISAEDWRKMLNLHYQQQNSAPEIAEEMDLSVQS